METKGIVKMYVSDTTTIEVSLKEITICDESVFDQEIQISQWSSYDYKSPTNKATSDNILGEVLPLEGNPNWLAKSLVLLDEVDKLPNGWDGYDSPPPLKKLLQNAKQFLLNLEFENIPVPFICPISGGGIQLEWHYPSRELEVEFIEPEVIGYLKVFEDGTMEEGEIATCDLDRARQIIGWLEANHEAIVRIG